MPVQLQEGKGAIKKIDLNEVIPGGEGSPVTYLRLQAKDPD